jgi:hypothetical protein
LLFLELAEDSFTIIPGSEVKKYKNKLRFSTRKKVMKDFAKKQTAEHVRLISGQGFYKLLFLELAEDSFILISGFEALTLKKSVFSGTKLRKSAGYESETLICLSHPLRLLPYPHFLSSAWTPRSGLDLGQ